MKIIIFGSTGMLGRYVYNILKKNHIIYKINRDKFNILNDKWSKLKKLLNKYNNIDVIINCAGIIPQKYNNDKYREYIRINTLFPHKLEMICGENIKLIHITTDCVFNGNKGGYNENDIHNETNIYGISKSLGELEESCVIRTSIIGEELCNKKSLLEWVKLNKNNEIKGFTNHLWNGITCLELSNIIEYIIINNKYWKGVKHIFSPNIISKYKLCNYINNIYNLNIKINKFETKKKVYKNLDSIYELNYNINDIETQIKNLKNFNLLGIYSNNSNNNH
tara:strand:+ start:3852 stop:4688 length:837 start_codon:yes stop_codon:yes gene_type:complete